MTDLIHRRSFLRGRGAALICAPAIVRVTSIMPVKAVRFLSSEEIFNQVLDEFVGRFEAYTSYFKWTPGQTTQLRYGSETGLQIDVVELYP